MKRRIAVIGSLGDGSATSSGQIIRTQITCDALIERYGKKSVFTVNTSLTKHRKIIFIARLLWSFIRCRDFVVILSSNGMKMVYPLLGFGAKHFHKRVFNSIVGGVVGRLIKCLPKCGKAMKYFEVNWVQLPSMLAELEEYGIYNGEVLPNFKPIHISGDGEVADEKPCPPYRFCTFSRISKAKGIEDAIRSISIINEEAKSTVATLDIFGVPDDDYKEEFDKLMKSVPNFIEYRGLISLDKTADTLKTYFMLLFPTTFDGEGFPGTLIDAFASGLPVIATDWRHNATVLTDGETGIIYDYRQSELLTEKIRWAIENSEKVFLMRKKCIDESKKYTPEKIMPIIFNRIDGKE